MSTQHKTQSMPWDLYIIVGKTEKVNIYKLYFNYNGEVLTNPLMIIL